jgi:excisionase family DNA binding protein
VEQLITVKQAADTLACEPSSIRKWLSQGRLPRVKVGRLTRLRARDVAAVVANGLPETRIKRGLRIVADTPTLPPCNSDSATGGSDAATQCGN